VFHAVDAVAGVDGDGYGWQGLTDLAPEKRSKQRSGRVSGEFNR
jgi:hypothetical protein